MPHQWSEEGDWRVWSQSALAFEMLRAQTHSRHQGEQASWPALALDLAI